MKPRKKKVNRRNMKKIATKIHKETQRKKEFKLLRVPLCHYLSNSCFFDKDFCDGSPGAPISAPKDGPKGLLRLRVPPALCTFVAKTNKEREYETNYNHLVNHCHHFDPGHLLMTWERNQGHPLS